MNPITCTYFVPTRKCSTFGKFLRKNGGDDETRTRDLCRDSIAWLVFTTTYNTAGTAKLRGSRTRHRILWVELWVGKSLQTLELPHPLFSDPVSGQWRGVSGQRDLASDLGDGVVSRVLPMTHGEFTQPRVDRGVLLGFHFFKQHTHAEDSEAAAGMHVEHFAM